VLTSKFSASTVNKDLTALRRVLRTAWRLGQIATDDYAAASDVVGIKGGDSSDVAGRAVTEKEIQALVDACPNTKEGKRDAAIVMVLALAGLRRAEVVGLNLTDYDGDNLTFRGKRNKLRRVSVAPIAHFINAWLSAGQGGGVDGPLFHTVSLDAPPRRLTVRALWVILKRLQVTAGVPPLTPHDMRRGFITNLLAAGEDVLTVSKLAGHSSPATTRRYDRRGDDVADAAIAKQKVPTRK